MTTLQVNLSPDLQTELGTAGVWAYAVYFDVNSSGTTVANWTTLVNNGSVENSGVADVPLPGTFSGGKVYFLIQSQTADIFNLPSLITSQSVINWGSATAWDFSYDSFEVTLKNTSTDVGNLTSVNSFGLPMEVSVNYTNLINGGTVMTTSTVG